MKNVVFSKQPENSENFEELLKIIKQKNIRIIATDMGDRLEIEQDVYFNFLWPNSKEFIQENKLNNNSIVCKLCYKKFSCLFTGDIEAVAEKQILKTYESELKVLNSDVLKVAHHGSKTSSTDEFLKAVSPKFALIGVRER